MARFRPNEYISPSTSEEAVSLLKQHGSKIRVLAGGTTFYELAKRGMMPEVERILDLSKLQLNYVKDQGEAISIGSMIVLTDLLKSGVGNNPGFQALQDFLTKFTPIQIRNLATVGGEICSGIPFLDLPVVALALDAKFRIAGSSGARAVSAESFFLDYFLVDLKKGEYLAEMQIPKMKPRTASAFVNLKRTATDLSLVNVAARIRTADNGTIAEASIGLGGMGQIPLRAHEVENSLNGKKIEQLNLPQSFKSIENLSPIGSVHASAWYKKEVCRVLIRDAVELAYKRSIGGGVVSQ